MSYTNTAYANIRNHTGIVLTSVTLHHQYSDDPDEGMTWQDVPAHSTTETSMTVGYNTGIIRIGQDYWWVQYTLPDGTVWISPGTLVETLDVRDQGTTKTFGIYGTIFAGFRGSVMQLTMRVPLGAAGYNCWAAISMRNDCPVSVALGLTHKYSTDDSYDQKWGPLAPGATTAADQAFIVYYNVGLIEGGTDYWNITMYLDMQPYDNAAADAFARIVNATTDKACMLRAEDNGMTHVFTVDGSGVTLGIHSGHCTDKWTTWKGYNTFAFFRLRNDFEPVISTCVVTHQYSSDPAWSQTRSLVRSGEVSDWMLAEFNTGTLRTGLDYWHIIVYLEDGTWFKNYRNSKECMLEVADAIAPSTFSVSQETFTLAMVSGSCTDSMLDMGKFSPSAGRDVNKPYDQNAFIGSHNAYANFEAGFWYAQQISSVQTQLALGATTLLLDIWYDDDDIYLLHQGLAYLQPFAAKQKLSDALTVIRNYLTLQQRDPVTVIFEDRVDEIHQPLIKHAFLTSNTWDMTFNPDSFDVEQNGWPTLTALFAMATPLIVLTSNNNSAYFAYQWKYMSENVYGDASINTATWLNPRTESAPLDKHALCALNHFATWSVASFKLPDWLTDSAKHNAFGGLTAMIDACHDRWHRYPNYMNADFWEVPPTALVQTTVYLNGKLHGAEYPVLRYENGRAIIEETDHTRLLRGNWKRATRWIDQHFGEICPQPDPDRPGPLFYQLGDAINLALVVAALNSARPATETVASSWIHKTLPELADYLLAIEPAVLRALDTQMAATDELCAIPYFLIERACGISFDLTAVVRGRVLGTAVSGDHDRLLLAGLAGQEGAVGQLTDGLATTRTIIGEARTSSRLYDLTHEILYLNQFGAPSNADPSLAVQIEELLVDAMASNADLGAELLACYWITGGTAGPASRASAQRLKAFSEEQPPECETDDDRACRCARFKEQIHGRLTTVLGLGVTLAIAGEILDDGDGPAG